MSVPIEFPNTHVSSEEANLIALCNEQYDAVAGSLIDGVYEGKSPALLSVVRPELLKGLAESAWKSASSRASIPHEDAGYKARLFSHYLSCAEHGNVEATSTLPKFATTLGELAISSEMILDSLDAVSEWRLARKHVQFIGSFNPQHIGHRFTVKRMLETAGGNANCIMQVVQDHPIKKDSLPPYKDRFKQGEARLYASNLIDPATVTLLDVPLSMGLAKKGDAQIALLAHVTGDKKGRWLVGSDKFMTDVRNVQNEKALDKAGVRFSNIELFVARRATEDAMEVEEGANYVRERFGAEVRLIPEIEDRHILMASASSIRAYRAEGQHAKADLLEFGDLCDLQGTDKL